MPRPRISAPIAHSSMIGPLSSAGAGDVAVSERVQSCVPEVVELQRDAAGEADVGLTVSALVAHAARYSLRCNDGRGASRRVPALRRALQDGGVQRGPLRVVLSLPRRDWRELEKDAEGQGETVERVIEHAAVHMIADLEAGKLELGGAGDGAGAALEQS